MSNETVNFRWDVFLSHSSKDKAIVRDIAERLRADGLRVWFDEWEIGVGETIGHKIEEGLEHSRLMVFCMSENAFGSDWAELETQTALFADPLNKKQRFAPVRLDGVEPKGTHRIRKYLDWNDGAGYPQLLEVCGGAREAVSEKEAAEKQAKQRQFEEKLRAGAIGLGHTDYVRSVAFSPDGKFALSGSDDYTVRLWEIESGQCLRVFEGHSGWVISVAFSADGKRALSGAADKSLRLWEIESGACQRVFEGHSGRVRSVAFSADGKRALSGADDS
ncbi:MAG: TIR domain-containing protein, partial [Verrucomicrobiota bacterium]